MTEALSRLSTEDLASLANALRTQRITPPFTTTRLQTVLSRTAAAAVSPVLQLLESREFSAPQLAATLELIASDRIAASRSNVPPELVTTGPEVQGITNRDTSVVVRDLFATAERSVLVAGYAVYQGQVVFQALADRMRDIPSLNVRMFLDIQRGPGDTSVASDLAKRFGNRFRLRQWPSDRPLPTLIYDPRSLELSSDKRACLHAKCIVIDGRSVFVSSANFTEAAQQRNIEVGVLLYDSQLAEQLTRYFELMLDERLLCPIS